MDVLLSGIKGPRSARQISNVVGTGIATFSRRGEGQKQGYKSVVRTGRR